MLKRIYDSPCANVAPITDGEPQREHRLVGGEKEGWGGADAEAHCIEGGRDSAGGSEEQVSLDADVVVAITGATKDLAWRG